MKPSQCWALYHDSEGSASYGVLIPVQFHLILVCIEVVYGVFRSVEHFNLRHFELCRNGEVQHPGCEWGFSLLHHGVHGDWSSALYCFRHMAKLLLDVLQPLLPRPLLCLLLIKDGSIAPVILVVPLLIAIFSRGFIRVVLPSVASFSFSIYFPRRVEVLLCLWGNGVLASLGLWRLLGELHMPGELLQLSQQALVGETECLHLIRIGLYGF